MTSVASIETFQRPPANPASDPQDPGFQTLMGNTLQQSLAGTPAPSRSTLEVDDSNSGIDSLPAGIQGVAVYPDSEALFYWLADRRVVAVDPVASPEAYQALLNHQAVLDSGGVIDTAATVKPPYAHGIVIDTVSAHYQDESGRWHWLARADNPALYAQLAALAIGPLPDPSAPLPPMAELLGTVDGTRQLLWSRQLAPYVPTLPTTLDFVALFNLGGPNGMTADEARYVNQMIAQSPTLVQQLKDAAASGLKIRWGEGEAAAHYEPLTKTIVLTREYVNGWDSATPEHRYQVGSFLLNALAHELGHARDPLTRSEPQPSKYARESTFRKIFLEHRATAEARADYNVLTIADELARNSGMDLVIVGASGVEGYQGSTLEAQYRRADLTPAEKIELMKKDARLKHPAFAGDGAYTRYAHQLWTQSVQQRPEL
ncbi:MAG: hypothetical protein V4739_15405 [Pseudomonadota bacterium]